MKAILKISVDKRSGYLVVGGGKNKAVAPWGYATGPNVVNLFDLKRTAKLIYNR